MRSSSFVGAEGSPLRRYSLTLQACPMSQRVRPMSLMSFQPVVSWPVFAMIVLGRAPRIFCKREILRSKVPSCGGVVARLDWKMRNTQKE